MSASRHVRPRFAIAGELTQHQKRGAVLNTDVELDTLTLAAGPRFVTGPRPDSPIVAFAQFLVGTSHWHVNVERLHLPTPTVWTVLLQPGAGINASLSRSLAFRAQGDIAFYTIGGYTETSIGLSLGLAFVFR